MGTDTLSVTFTPADTTTYTSVTQTAAITVGQATLTVTAGNASRAYGAANPAFTAAAAGAVNGDTFTLTASTTATASSPVGTYAIVPLATGSNLSSYNVVYVDGTLTVGKATPVVTWANPAGISYGTALSSTQLDASSTTPGSFVYTPAAGAILPVGTDTLSVTFTPADTTTYTSVTQTAAIAVGQATLTVTAGNASRAYGAANPAFTAAAAGAVNGDTFTLTASTTATASSPVGTYAIVPLATGSNLSSYNVVYVDGTLTVGKATPVVTWANPAGISYGTALSSTQLDASSTTPGTFVYTPAAGAILPVGTDTLSVTFTPADTTTYTSVTQTAAITVGQATLTVTAGNASRAYGAANPAFTAAAAGAVNGDTFTLTASTTATASSPVGTYAIVPLATGSNLSSYNVVYVDGTLTVGKATLTVTAIDASRAYGAANPVFTGITTGAANGDTFTVSGTTTATVASSIGTYAIVPTVTGADLANYTPVYVNGTLTVGQATLTVTANNATRIYGAANPVFTGNAAGALNGDTFTITGTTTATGTSPAGTYSIVPLATGTNLSDYTVVYVNGTLTVGQATPVITWTPPAAITYGTALSGTELNATSTIAGAFAYTPAAGTVLGAGTTTLTATFTPTDTVDYTTQTATVTLTVNKSTPTITWTPPAAITYGTALSGTELNATSTIAGGFAYTPPAGTVLGAGSNTLTATFTPTDTVDYTTQTATVTLTVNKSTPTITWVQPAAITYGTALSSAQLDATSTVAGTFVYTPAAGDVPSAGTNTLSVVFTPNDTANYTTQTATVTLTVNKSTPTITWGPPAAITYGTALSGTQLNATGSVAGSFSYSPAAGTVLAAGTTTLTATFTPTDPSNYTTQTATVTLTVNKATPSITWGTPAPITYGTALSSTQLDATSTVAGGFVYTPAAGTILAAGSNTLTATFTPTDTADYTTQTATVNLVVIAAAPVINWTNPASIVYGTPLGSAQLDATASTPGGAALAGSFSYGPAAGAVLSVGTQPLTATFTPDDTADFTTVKKTVTIDVQQATLVVMANDASNIYGTANPTFSGTITGMQNGDTFAESFSTTATTLSNAGTYSIIPAASGTNIADYSQTVKNGTLTINKASVVSTLSLSTPSSPYGLNVTMTVTIKSATSGTPTGTVSFFDNGTLMGTSPINGNTAVYSSTTLGVGNHVISTLYSGDANFNAQTVGGTTASGTILITPLDFSLQLTSTATLHGVYGTGGTYTFHIAPIGGSYPGEVTITVNGAHGPISATYTFSKKSLGMYSGPADITLAISTRRLAQLDRPANPFGPLGQIAMGLFLIPLMSVKRLRKSGRKLGRAIGMAALLLVALGGMASLTGCGTGYYSSDDPIIVTATSNGVQHNVTVVYHIDKSTE